jgi:hypothetical protein
LNSIGSSQIILLSRHAEIFGKYFSQKNIFCVKENEACFGLFGNSLFVEMEPSKLMGRETW